MSEQVRGQVDDQHVHHSRQQRVTGKRRPALDQHLVDTAGTQCPQQTRQIDAPAKLRQAQHIGTGGAQFRFCLARCGLAAHDQSLTRQAEHAGTRWRAQPGIEHHTQRLAQIVDGLDAGQLPGLQANVHRGIIRQHAADPGDHGAAAGTQPLHVKARIGTGYPLALTAGHRGPAIQAHRQLAAHIGTTVTHALQKPGIEPLGIGGEETNLRVDPGIAQHRQSTTGHQRVGIGHCRHNTAHASIDQPLCAGWCTPMMGAGLQRDIGRRAARAVTRGRQRDALGMGLPGLSVPTLADHLPVAHQHTADARIGVGRIQAAFGQAQGVRHETVVIGAAGAAH